jgi:hypothetical protein
VRRPTQMRQDLQRQQLAAYVPLGVVLVSNLGQPRLIQLYERAVVAQLARLTG